MSLHEIFLILPSANINPGGDFVGIDISHSFSFKLEICISLASWEERRIILIELLRLR